MLLHLDGKNANVQLHELHAPSYHLFRVSHLTDRQQARGAVASVLHRSNTRSVLTYLYIS